MPKTNKSVCMKTLRLIAENQTETTENRLDAVRMLLSMDTKSSTSKKPTSKRTQASNSQELREALTQ
jgi:hypothetical protein